MVETEILKGKLAHNDGQTHVLKDKVQSLKGIGASMATLLGSRLNLHVVISQDF